MHAHAHPERDVGGGLLLEAFGDRQARPQRSHRLREREHQAVAEILHHARAVRQRGAHHLLLPVEQGERLVVAVLGGELGEPDDVGEDHRARGRPVHRSTTWMFPLSVFTLISPSSPARQSQRTSPLSVLRRVAGCAPCGTVTVTDPDIALTSRRPGPASPTSTLPLPAFTLAPSTSSASTFPEPSLLPPAPPRRIRGPGPPPSRCGRRAARRARPGRSRSPPSRARRRAVPAARRCPSWRR